MTTQPDITDDYDYSYDDEPEEEVGETNEEVPASDAQNQNEEKTDDEERDGTSIVPIIIAVCLIILVGGLVLIMGLHYKRKLPASFYK